ncbi:hypothetical protein L211DRAFT_832486 [Terfezia boudieri ATCC MYA-4762]|uniref:Uncharacterized protein n=1 Tax=Terfezia boudieri ATCC MYA-4762 TaxID=1051890 RepID=A0A3N4M413_9PEZI|nr:hypothetical protein L211DRAFT_832486 [Terfezia boudieri ATCC MYA-4762]
MGLFLIISLHFGKLYGHSGATVLEHSEQITEHHAAPAQCNSCLIEQTEHTQSDPHEIKDGPNCLRDETALKLN